MNKIGSLDSGDTSFFLAVMFQERIGTKESVFVLL